MNNEICCRPVSRLSSNTLVKDSLPGQKLEAHPSTSWALLTQTQGIIRLATIIPGTGPYLGPEQSM